MNNDPLGKPLMPNRGVGFQGITDHRSLPCTWPKLNKSRLRRCLGLLSVTLWLGAVAATAWASKAEEILNRPNRLAEEYAAWNPKPISMEEFLNPSIPLKEQYPTIVVDAPLGGVAFWMDNRYALVWQGGQKDKETGIAVPHIGVLDTDTGEAYPYKPGQLKCYWDNRLVYETGPVKDVKQRKRWAGAPGEGEQSFQLNQFPLKLLICRHVHDAA